MMLSLLISISKQPGNDINIYLVPLIEHLKTLWDVSAYMFNAYRKQTFNVRAVLMWTINDFTLYRKLSRCTIKGYYGYPVCRINTCACWLPHSGKMLYMGYNQFPETLLNLYLVWRS